MPEAIGDAFGDVIATLIAALPNIIGALLLLVVGWILSGILGRLVSTLLFRGGADRLFAQHGTHIYGTQTQQVSPSRVSGEVVKWLVRLVFLVAAANLLGLTQISLLLNQIILWLPNLFVAAVILLVAPLIGRFVRGSIEVGAGQMGFTNAPFLGRLAEVAIIAFAVVIAINQLGIATTLVNTLFTGLVAAVSIAVGIAFGLGGRNVAEQLWQQWYTSSQTAAERVRAAQQSAAQGGYAQGAYEQGGAYGQPGGYAQPAGYGQEEQAYSPPPGFDPTATAGAGGGYGQTQPGYGPRGAQPGQPGQAGPGYGQAGPAGQVPPGYEQQPPPPPQRRSR